MELKDWIADLLYDDSKLAKLQPEEEFSLYFAQVMDFIH